jgi:hypothetical protein
MLKLEILNGTLVGCQVMIAAFAMMVPLELGLQATASELLVQSVAVQGETMTLERGT